MLIYVNREESCQTDNIYIWCKVAKMVVVETAVHTIKWEIYFVFKWHETYELYLKNEFPVIFKWKKNSITRVYAIMKLKTKNEKWSWKYDKMGPFDLTVLVA